MAVLVTPLRSLSSIAFRKLNAPTKNETTRGRGESSVDEARRPGRLACIDAVDGEQYEVVTAALTDECLQTLKRGVELLAVFRFIGRNEQGQGSIRWGEIGKQVT